MNRYLTRERAEEVAHRRAVLTQSPRLVALTMHTVRWWAVCSEVEYRRYNLMPAVVVFHADGHREDR
jgi:hypothetical protein